MGSESFDIDVDGPGGLRLRGTSLAAHLIGTVLPTLPGTVQMRIRHLALQKRIEAVRHVKKEFGERPWEWEPGDPLPADDGTANALLGTGTFHLYLAETMVEELMGSTFADANVPEMEAFFGFDGRAKLAYDAQRGVL